MPGDVFYMLEKLKIGDILHANSPTGGSLICLISKISHTHIYARTVTTQFEIKFNIQTGSGVRVDDNVVCTIDSVAPLPVDIHNIMLGFDRKFRLARENVQLQMNDEEKKALLFVADFYRENQL